MPTSLHPELSRRALRPLGSCPNDAALCPYRFKSRGCHDDGGEVQDLRCPHCGAALSSGARYCSQCGKPPQAERTTVDTGGGALVYGNVETGRDFVGRDQIGATTTGMTGADAAALFGAIYRQIDARPDTTPEDRKEMADIVRKVEGEAGKGDDADEGRLLRWLRFLADMAPDIWDVTVATLANPAVGVATVIQKVAARARQPAPGA